ncbi:MAG: hypothetical protein QOJ30_4140, partial [Pseudonocardiales bacterium]|nr:hypothetical protein [Pseudonocardiales bacterium]
MPRPRTVWVRHISQRGQQTTPHSLVVHNLDQVVQGQTRSAMMTQRAWSLVTITGVGTFMIIRWAMSPQHFHGRVAPSPQVNAYGTRTCRGPLGLLLVPPRTSSFAPGRSAPARKVAESNAWSANSSIPGCSRFSSRRARWASSRSPGWPMAPPITAQRRASFRAPREATRRAYTRRGAQRRAGQRRAGQRLPRLGRGPNDTIQLQDHTNRSLYGSLEITQAIARHVFKERGRPGLPACVGPVGSSQPIKRERPAHHWPSSASNTLIS